MPTRVDKKAPTEAYTLCSKEQEWGHLARLKILDNNGYTSYLFIYLLALVILGLHCCVGFL